MYYTNEQYREIAAVKATTPLRAGDVERLTEALLREEPVLVDGTLLVMYNDPDIGKLIKGENQLGIVVAASEKFDAAACEEAIAWASIQLTDPDVPYAPSTWPGEALQGQEEPLDADFRVISEIDGKDRRQVIADLLQTEKSQAKREQLLTDPEKLAAYAAERGITVAEMRALLTTNFESNATRLAELRELVERMPDQSPRPSIGWKELQGEAALLDTSATSAKTGLQAALLAATRETRWGPVSDPIAEDILKAASFDALDKALHERGFRDLKPLAGGAFNYVLDAGDKVVRVGFGPLLQRPDIPEILQPLDAGVAGNLRFEILPKVDTESITQNDVETVTAALAARGYAWGDAGTDNIGRYRGALIVFDPDGVVLRQDRNEMLAKHETVVGLDVKLDLSSPISSGALAAELERVATEVRRAVAGDRPELAPAEREQVVRLAESAMSHRHRSVAGSDPAARSAGDMLEPHQFAAMDLARALAAHDSPRMMNPFRDENLAPSYGREQLFLARQETLARSSNPYLQGRKSGADAQYVVHETANRKIQVFNDPAAAAAAYAAADAKLSPRVLYTAGNGGATVIASTVDLGRGPQKIASTTIADNGQFKQAFDMKMSAQVDRQAARGMRR
ncbi:MAG TPA: hypothetical protein VEC35_09385 [Noviherbaspirillum sp.]|nr:hypothetical protein [Noviherbaspirillum sp.]